MRSVSLPRTLGLTVGSLLLAATLGASAVVEGLLVRSEPNAESVKVRWSEAASVQVDEFPSSNQVVVTLRGGRIAANADRLLTPEGLRMIRRVQAQEVTLADGSPGLQITLTLHAWAKVTVESGTGVLSLSVAAPSSASTDAPGDTPAAAVEPGLVFTDEMLRNLDGATLGADGAPAEGAGQGAAGTDAPAARPSFFVPPDLTEEQRKSDTVEDIGMLVTEGIFKQRIARLDFKDAPLQNVIRLIANETRLNIILTPQQVPGTVTLSLRDVTIGDALDAILKANNLATKVETGGIVRIVPRSTVQSTEKETVIQPVTVNWVSADEVASTLRPFLTGDDVGEISVSPASNVLIIRDVPENLARLQQMIRLIDQAELQVKMEVRMVDMTDRAARDLGFRANISSADDTVGQLNTDGSLNTEDDAPVFPRQNYGVGQLPASGDALSISEGTGIQIFRNEYNLDLQLRAQEIRNQATTLAAPVILSLNNQPASVEILRREPYLGAQSTTDGAVATVEFVEIGTQVELTPRITRNGFVQMRIQPEQSILRGFADLGNRRVPIEDERRLDTNVIVRDEDTVALGGLRQFEAQTSESGVPFLMRVPVLSWLFKSNSNNQQRTELVLFVTPSIVKSLTPNAYEKALYDKIDYNWDLPDYYFDQVQVRKAPTEKDTRRVYGE